MLVKKECKIIQLLKDFSEKNFKTFTTCLSTFNLPKRLILGATSFFLTSKLKFNRLKETSRIYFQLFV